MPRNFPGSLMPSPIQVYPRNSLDERREKEIAELRALAAKARAFAGHGSTGGSKKHVNQAPLRSVANESVNEAWLKWQKRTGANFEAFWPSEAPRIYRNLKRREKLKEIPWGAAKTLLRRGKPGQYVTARTMKANLRSLPTRHNSNPQNPHAKK
jgi:hypothetical protein